MAHVAAPPASDQPIASDQPVAFADIDLDSLPGQIGAAVLRASDGAVLRPPASPDLLSDHDLSILYRMLREVGDVVPDGEGLRRIEVSFQGGVRYTVALAGDGTGDGFVYILKRRQATE